MLVNAPSPCLWFAVDLGGPNLIELLEAESRRRDQSALIFESRSHCVVELVQTKPHESAQRSRHDEQHPAQISDEPAPHLR